jgi:hypothetical protein
MRHMPSGFRPCCPLSTSNALFASNGAQASPTCLCSIPSCMCSLEIAVLLNHFSLQYLTPLLLEVFTPALLVMHVICDHVAFTSPTTNGAHCCHWLRPSGRDETVECELPPAPQGPLSR